MLADKAQVRRDTRSKIRELSDGGRASASQTISKRIIDHLSPGATVLGFWPLTKSEPDLRPALTAALDSEVTLCLPRTDGTQMAAHAVNDFEQLVRSGFGVLEPSRGLPEIDPAAIDLVLVPGVAFTPGGARLGRGGGHYDRFLARLSPQAMKLGIAFSVQLLPALPTEAHDLSVDQVITD
jgi:5-formyltetrahydrofolate cyclo-ligase